MPDIRYKTAEAVFAQLLLRGVFDETGSLSGEFHRRWRQLQLAVEHSPWAMEKARREGINIPDATRIPAIVSYFPEGIHQEDMEIAFNITTDWLNKIGAIPLRE